MKNNNRRVILNRFFEELEDETKWTRARVEAQIYSAVILFNPDRALVGIRLLNEECSRSCMETYVVLYRYIVPCFEYVGTFFK